MDNLPCPFCGSTDLVENTWNVDDADGPFSEVEAVECNSCKAGALRSAWNNRAADDITAKVRTMRALQIEYFRTRDRGILARSKEAERELDQLLSGFEQNDLFYSGGDCEGEN